MAASFDEPGVWYFLLQEHHIIGDHISLDLEIDEVKLILDGKESQLTPSIPYRELVSYTLERTRQYDAENFFQKTLGGFEEPSLAFGLNDVYGDGSESIALVREIPRELSTKIRVLIKQHGVSAASFFHLAWALVVAKTSGQDDVVFGTVMSGRLQGVQGADQMLGMFINLLPIRIDLENTNVIDALNNTQLALIDLLNYEQTPLSVAQRCSQLSADTPLFNAMFNYRHELHNDNTQEQEEDWDGVELLTIKEHTNYPLEVAIDDNGKDFSIEANVHNSVSTERVIDYFHRASEVLVEGMEKMSTSAEPQAVLASSILPSKEKQQLLAMSGADNKTLMPYQHTVDEHFEKHVEATPDAIALVDLTHDTTSYTYRQLNQTANQLAHYLRTCHGVTAGDFVAIEMSRCAEQVIAQLAILKLAAIYIPIDPELPEDRKEYFVDSAKACCVLSLSTCLLYTSPSPRDRG